MTVNLTHCWEEGPDGESTCLLDEGHVCPHEFTPDDAIEIEFSNVDEAVDYLLKETTD